MTLIVSSRLRLFWNRCPGKTRALEGKGGSARSLVLPCLAAVGLLAWLTPACSNRNPAASDSKLLFDPTREECEDSASPACGDAGEPPRESDLPACDSTLYQEDVVSPTSGAHTEQPQTYDGKPPAGGPHSGCWGTWGVHTTPLIPERFVHNLEHGGIVLTYNCAEGCDAELLWMQEFALTRELVVLTEYPALTSRFGISAWNARAYSDCLSADFVRDFYERRVDRAPEAFGRPPPGPPSSCL